MKLEELRRRIHEIANGLPTNKLKARKEMERLIHERLGKLLPLVTEAKLIDIQYNLCPSIPNGAKRAEAKRKVVEGINEARDYIWVKYRTRFSEWIDQETMERIFNDALELVVG